MCCFCLLADGACLLPCLLAVQLKLFNAATVEILKWNAFLESEKAAMLARRMATMYISTTHQHAIADHLATRTSTCVEAHWKAHEDS